MTLYMPLFRSCTTFRTLTQLHAHLFVSGLLPNDPLPSTKLIESYAQTGSLKSSRLVFETFPTPDSFMWGVLIKCHVWNHFFQEAIFLYHRLVHQGVQISNFVFPSVLRACAGFGDLGVGKKVHCRIIKCGYDNDAVIETSVLSMYGETGCFGDLRKVFDKMSDRDVVSWSTVISSCVENGDVAEGIGVFCDMVRNGVEPDAVTMITVAEACAELGCLRLARSVHGQIVMRMIGCDESLANSLLVMYSKCGDMFSAEKIFVNSANKTTTSWTAMISSYNRSSSYEKAFQACYEMLHSKCEPNSVALTSVLSSCSMLGRVKQGKSIHCFVVRKNLEPEYEYVAPALIEFYAKCGRLIECEKVLCLIGARNIVAWNTLISIYVQKGYPIEALNLFKEIQRQGMMPDSFSLASSVSGCVDFGLLWQGDQIHGHVIKRGILDEFVLNSLVDMYSKYGLVNSAYVIFNSMEEKGLVAWNSMICGYSQNGNSIEAIFLFDHMYLNSLEMNEVTFLSVIQACSNLGYLEKGKWVHHKIISYGKDKDLYTNTALIDMYAKCGDLETAKKVFGTMTDWSVVSWSALINGYGMHGQIGAAISTFQQMLKSEIKPNEVTFMNILSACSHSGSVEKGKFYLSMMKAFGIKPNSEHFACVIDLLSRAGELKEAYSIIKSMPLRADASIWGSLINGCRIYRRMDMIEAIKDELKGIATNDSGFYALLSNIYAEEGNWDEFRKVRSSLKSTGLNKVPGYSTIEIDKNVYRFGAGDTFHVQTDGIQGFLENFQNLSLEHRYQFDAVEDHSLTANGIL